MPGRAAAAVGSLVIGILLAAWSLANGQLLLAIVGFVLILTFLFLAIEALNKAAKPAHEIKPSKDSVWQMKDSSEKGNEGKP